MMSGVPSQTGQRTLRVVLADDSPDSRALLRAMLHTVREVEVVGVASDGRQLVSEVEEKQPDVAFVDIAMPVMDGLEATKQIRARKLEVKVIMFSAFNRKQMGPAAGDAGADAYVEKAATVEQLFAQVSTLFPDLPMTPRPRTPVPAQRSGPEQPKQEQRYHLLLDALAEGVLTVDAAGQVKAANFSATQILGHPMHRLTGMSLPEAGLDGDDNGRGPGAILAAVRAGAPLSNVEHTLEGPEGDARWLLVSVRPLDHATDDVLPESLVSFVDVTERLRAEREVAASEQRLRHATEAMLDGFAVLSTVTDSTGTAVDLRYEFINDAGCRINGRTREEHLGHTMLELFGGYEDTPTFAQYLTALTTRQPVEGRLVLPSPVQPAGGTYDVRAVPTSEGLALTFRDVTGQVAEQESLAARERLLRQTFEVMHEGLGILDPVRGESGRVVDFRWEYVNEAGCAITGRRRDELEHHLLSEVTPGDHGSDLVGDLVAVVEDQQAMSRPARSLDGPRGGDATAERRFNVNAFPTDGKLVVVLREVAEKQAHARAQESEEKLRIAVEGLDDAFFLVQAVRDDQGRLVDFRCEMANAAATAVTGRPLEEIVDHTMLETFPHTEVGIFDLLRDVLETGRPLHTVTDYHADAVDGSFEVQARRVSDCLVIVARDVAAQRRNEQQHAAAHQQVRAPVEELERSNRDLEEFAAAVSHDLREPLRTIAGFSHLLEEGHGGDLPTEGREMLDLIIDGADRMNERIQGILDFARVGADVHALGPVPLDEVVEAARQELSELVSETGATVDAVSLPVVHGDVAQLQRVMLNLLANAVSYCPADRVPHVVVDAVGQDDGWRVRVADNGPGVPVRSRERIFDMFTREPTGHDRPGTGMGLALCRRLITAYGGRIWVEDNPGGGSRFCFTLPFPEAGAARTEPGGSHG